MTDTSEPRGVLGDPGDYTPVNNEDAADLADDDAPLLVLPADDDDEGSVAPGAEGLPDDVRDGDISEHETEEI